MPRIHSSYLLPALPSRWLSTLCLLALATLGPLAAPTPAGAQVTPLTLSVSDTIFAVRLVDGATYIGRIVEADGERLTLQNPAGVRVQFARAQIQNVRVARGRIEGGEFWREDAHKTRLFFAPTGRTLNAGDGYLGLFYILPFVSYGLTDMVTISGGLPLIGSFDEGIPAFYLAPKVRVVGTENTQVSAGVLAFFSGDETAGIGYGVGTFGDSDRAVSVGAGIPFAGGETADRFVAMVGGEYRTGRRTKLLTENWFVPGEQGALLTGGVRLMGERWTTDLGLALAMDGSSGFYFPMVSFAYAFGGR
jgi:hypothetical protein